MKPLLTIVQVSMYTQECVNIFHPETGVRTIADFVNRVNDLSKTFVENGGKVEKDFDKANSFKGDMLEVLGEIFFTAFQNDPKVGIKDYIPVPLAEDYGVDAVGRSVLDNVVVVQCKFKSDPTTAITYEELVKTSDRGHRRHNLSLEEDDNIIVFTTCNSVNRNVKAALGSSVRLIGRDIISIRIDNNLSFWEEAGQRVLATINKLLVP